MAPYPCGKCGVECDGDKNIACDMCNTWFHQTCESLNNHQFSFLCKTTLPYLCSSCCLDSDGNFDFNSALKRLSSHGCTLEAAKLERIFSRSLAHKYKFTKIAGSFIKDLVASELIGPRSGFEAVKTKGDGNCLFNSLSLAIHNNEVLATELRYRTCLEMILNRDYYIDVHGESDLRFVSGSFDDSLVDCAKNYSFSTAYTIHAASTVIGRAIRSFYPGVNGICDVV